MLKHFVRLGLLGLLPATASAQVPLKIYGQELIDRTVAGDRRLLLAQMHVAPAAGAASVVVASNVGQFGSPADATELEVMATNKVEAGLLPGGTRLKMELPLLDVVGETIGVLTLEWSCHGAGDMAALSRRAGQVRAALSRRILNAANLFDQFPLDPAATTSTRAQKLVDGLQAAHPEVEVLAVRGRSGATGELVLLGSTFGRHGKKADQDDLKVLEATAPTTGVYSTGKRFGIDLPLHDRGGAAIGTMNVGYAYRDGADAQALVARSLRLRDELQRRLAADPALDRLDP